MIEKLQIRNFRAHKRLDIDFSPLVNSIVGQNAVGKSTIIRAIKWVVKNKPAGDSIIKWDADKASVRLIVDENKITRTRSKDVNTYRLNKEKSYKAFRNEVPKDIERIVNLSDINFQGQHDAPFWFCETAGEVSRQLNTIVNLEGIDNTLKNLTSTLHKSRTTIEVIEDRLHKISSQQDSLVYIKEMDGELKEVEHLQEEYQENSSKQATLSDILKLVSLHGLQGDRAAGISRDGIIALSRGRLYQKIVIQVENLSKAVKLAKSLLITINKKPPSLSHLESIKKKQVILFNQYSGLKNLVQKIITHEEIKCQTEEDLKTYKKDMNKVAGGRCPLCGTKMMKKL